MTTRAVFTLVSDIGAATKIVKSAQSHHLNIRNFDRAERLEKAAQSFVPTLVIVDWDSLESEGYKILKAFRENAELKDVNVVGYVSRNKESVKAEAERAGCLRVFLKTDFFRDLSDVWVRYIL